MTCVSVCLALPPELTYGPEIWHGGYVEGYLGQVRRSRSLGQKTFLCISLGCLLDLRDALYDCCLGSNSGRYDFEEH